MSDIQEIKTQFKITLIIYYALITGLLFVFIVALFIIQNLNAELNKELDNFFLIIVPIFGLLMMYFSRVVYKKKISGYNPDNSLVQKLMDFRTFKIIMWAMIEGACFFSLVALMVTANYLYAVVFIFLFGYFLLVRPTKESFITDMRLKTEESNLILKN